MMPVWGRKFEPPAVASRETGASIEALLMLHARTGDTRYLDAAAQAGEWLRAVALEEDEWSRFYELRTNRPLFVNRDNEIVYDQVDLITHYTLKSDFGLPEILDRLERARAGEPEPLGSYWPSRADGLSKGKLRDEVEALLRRQDVSGIWIDDGLIGSDELVNAIFTLSRFAQAD
jgi:hypothetical protein